MGDLEIVLVDDGSLDKSWLLLKQLKVSRSFMKIYRLSNNFGQAAATLCGIDFSSGDVIITIDDDLQYPSIEIPRMIGFFHDNPTYLAMSALQFEPRR
jgi:glycosyltransferase involved in cell wall biosynthesis